VAQTARQTGIDLTRMRAMKSFVQRNLQTS